MENRQYLLGKLFKLSSTSVINAFKDYVEEAGQHIPKDLQSLINFSEVIPSSTAECKRGFSHGNIIIIPKHSRILINQVSSLLFVRLHGLPLKHWDPTLM